MTKVLFKSDAEGQMNIVQRRGGQIVVAYEEPCDEHKWKLLLMIILALSGSLRAASINSALCRACSLLAPAGTSIVVYSGLGQLPLFNAELESSPPQQVLELRRLVGAADAVLIASPEYAHGLSGPLKNALDWLVAYEGFYGKPVAAVNTSPRAHHAYDSLIEVLRTMSAILIESASISIPLLGNCVTVESIVAADAISAQVKGMLEQMRAHMQGVGDARQLFRLESP
ncbi:MAG: NADPH-dependent FMN reductase [Pseudomonadota bacterium]